MIHLLVHYHMRSGGVSGVIREEIRALRGLGHEVALMTSAEVCDVECRVLVVPELDYARAGECDAEALWQMVRREVAALAEEVTWHIHNPLLGCHVAWSRVVGRLAAEGERMVLHLHDFAEDGRAENRAALGEVAQLYPLGERIRYVVLTRRDARALQGAGLPKEWCHVVANPLAEVRGCAAAEVEPFVLYPTRGIVRKNVGELCLLAAMAPRGARFATTLHPGASRKQQDYAWWRDWARKLELPVEFGVADEQGGDLAMWMKRATHVVSTSRQEGFGMAFVECVAWRRPMLGRAIAHVDEDLRELYGVAHPYLYDRLEDERGRDFSQMAREEAASVLVDVRWGKARMRVVRDGVVKDARAWLAEALEHRQALAAGCLRAFSAEEHGRSIAAIAAEVAGETCGLQGWLDRGRVEEFFLRGCSLAVNHA
jgi:hypothetical protein